MEEWLGPFAELINSSGIRLGYGPRDRQEVLSIREARRYVSGTGLRNFHAGQKFETVVGEQEQWI